MKDRDPPHSQLGVLERKKDLGVGRICLAIWAFFVTLPSLPQLHFFLSVFLFSLLPFPYCSPAPYFPATTRGRSGTTGTQEYPLGYLVSLGWGRHSGEDLPAFGLFQPALSLGLALDYLLGLCGTMVCLGRGSEMVPSLGTRQNQLPPQPSPSLEL